VPELSRFLGIVIAMFYRDHEPANFHAVYGEYEITVGIEDGIVKGEFPRRALRHVLEWYEMHKAELAENWTRQKSVNRCCPSRPWSKAMIRVTEAKWVRDFIVRLRFSDGLEGEVDFREELDGPVFAPLRDVDAFKRFELHPELHTLVWENGADFAPEFLHSLVRVPA
jgi:hypothetical protein